MAKSQLVLKGCFRCSTGDCFLVLIRELHTKLFPSVLLSANNGLLLYGITVFCGPLYLFQPYYEIPACYGTNAETRPVSGFQQSFSSPFAPQNAYGGGGPMRYPGSGDGRWRGSGGRPQTSYNRGGGFTPNSSPYCNTGQSPYNRFSNNVSSSSFPIQYFASISCLFTSNLSIVPHLSCISSQFSHVNKPMVC